MERKRDEPSVVMVTGANRGIGLALVSQYVERGCRVIATCRSPDRANDLKDVMAREKGGSFIIQLDIDNERSVAEAFNLVSRKVKGIDILINNAGIATKNHPNDPVLKVDPEDMLKVYRVNVIGTWRVITTFMPLVRNRGAKVLALSSDLASIANNCQNSPIGQAPGDKTSYRCSKAAVNMLIRNFAVEIPDVIFLAVSPGWVATRMGASAGRKPPLTTTQSSKRIVRMAAALKRVDSGAFWTAKFEEYEKWACNF